MIRAEAIARRNLRWDRRSSVRAAGAARARRAGPCVVDPSTGKRSGGWEAVPFRRTCSCGFAKGTVGVAWSSSADTAYPASGVITCGSVWACPVCSSKIRRVRTSEVETVAQWHADNGGELVMLTLTLRHTRGDSLATLVRGLSDAWRAVQASPTWKARRKSLSGMVRALEVTQSFTVGGGGGWHPHLHVLLLVPAGADATDVALDVGLELTRGWGDAVANALGEKFRPSDAVGVDVRVIAAGAARYVTKISMEVTRADLKDGDRSIWSLIDLEYWRRWGEYCAAMKGRRAVQFSRGLRAAAGLAVLTEAEACALDLDEGVIVAVFEHRQWNRMMKTHGEVLLILDAIAVRCRRVRVLVDSG